MALRLGIEISRAACRVVQIEHASRTEDDETIVRACAALPAADLATALAPYRGQRASVVMWGLPSDHRQAVVTVGSYARMRREAVSAARQAGIDTREMLADIAPAAAAQSDGRRRPVVIALARTADIAAAARRVADAGVRVRSVVTPALALMSLARLRRRLLAPGLAETYVALEEASTALALVRDGALVAAREVEWGFRGDTGEPRSRDEVAETLGNTIRDFFGDYGVRPSAVAQICVCGGMLELRSMTIALTEHLDVEVEPLDSLFAIDPDRLPSDDFRDRAADLRLAWAAAADWNAPINFLRERRRRAVKHVLTRAAIVAGVATGLGIAWRVQQSAWLEPSKPAAKPRPAAAAPVPPAPRPRPAAPAPPPAVARATPPPPVARATPPPPVARATPPPPAVARATSPPVVRPTPVPVTPTPPPVARATPPPLVLTPVPEPPKPAPAREPETSFSAPRAAAPPRAVVAAPPVVRRPPPEDVPLPFDGTLGTILYGADRKLAIVDGRIVQVGDDVRGARVVEITPNSVLFRDRAGQLRQLGLDGRR